MIRDFWTTSVNPITMERSEKTNKYSERINKCTDDGKFQHIDFSVDSDYSLVKNYINNNKFESIIALIQ